MCDTCSNWRDIDLDELPEKIGADFSLWNRRTRCRLTEGSHGWNRFYYGGSGAERPRLTTFGELTR
jgi:hypothetical protein